MTVFHYVLDFIYTIFPCSKEYSAPLYTVREVFYYRTKKEFVVMIGILLQEVHGNK